MTVSSEPRTDIDEGGAHGESLLPVLERLIVSTGDGIFEPLPPDLVTTEGEIVRAGQVFGVVRSLAAETTVTSRFTGFLMGMLAKSGERVHVGQPLAWLRVLETPA